MVIGNNVGGPTSLLEVLPDDVYNELIPQLKKDVGNLMLVSQRVCTACLNAQLGWKQLLPENYRWVQNPRAVVGEAWKEEHNMKCDADRTAGQVGGCFKTCLGMTYYRPIREVSDRIVPLLSLWKTRDSENAITSSEIAQWVAIEMLLTRTIELAEAKPTRTRNDVWHMRARSERNLVGGMALLGKEYFSPKLFRVLSRKCDLVSSFFRLFWSRHGIQDYHLDDTEWKDLARFALENQYELGLCTCGDDILQQLQTWFGSELQALSIEYRIFGVQGRMGIRRMKLLSRVVIWKKFLLKESTSPEIPAIEYPLPYLQRLVRVSKYVFHDSEQLVRFILWVLQKGHKEVLLGEGIGTSSVDEFLVDFEGRLKTVVKTVVADDNAPFCPHPEYQEDHDFVYGRLGPYLVEPLIVAPF